MPVVPPAPATFSITICCPSVRDMCSPTMRAMMSVGPPAANGTIMRDRAWSDRSWACAPHAAKTSAAASREQGLSSLASLPSLRLLFWLAWAMPQPGRPARCGAYSTKTSSRLFRIEGRRAMIRSTAASEQSRERVRRLTGRSIEGQEDTVAARDDQRLAQLLLHQLAEHEAEQHRRRLEAELDQAHSRTGRRRR